MYQPVRAVAGFASHHVDEVITGIARFVVTGGGSVVTPGSCIILFLMTDSSSISVVLSLELSVSILQCCAVLSCLFTINSSTTLTVG